MFQYIFILSIFYYIIYIYGQCIDPIVTSCKGNKCADLIVDKSTLISDLVFDKIHASDESCFFEEKCVNGLGERTILRFSTLIKNIGQSDINIVNTLVEQQCKKTKHWEYHACHDHWHFLNLTFYELFNKDLNASQIPDNEKNNLITVGRKNSFCFADTDCLEGNSIFTCENQGLSIGCGDLYPNDLDCQWIDMTDLPDGNYALRITVNPSHIIEEMNYENNIIEYNFHTNDIPWVQDKQRERFIIIFVPIILLLFIFIIFIYIFFFLLNYK